MADGDFVPIPTSHQAGATAVNVFAVLSIMALVSVAARILWLAIRKLWTSEPVRSQEYIFFHTQLGNYAACLLFGNALNSTAGLMGFPWTLQKGITNGGVCRTQAFIMQVGNWSSAYFTIAIAVHTFNSLVLKKRQSIMISLPTMIIGWMIAGIGAGVPFLLREPEGPVYGPDGFACGVRAVFPKLQFIFHLLPIFIASLASVFLYSLIFLVLRRTLIIKGGLKLTLDPKERWDGDMENYHRFIARVAKSLLWYPIAYVGLLVPYSVMRLLDISGFRIAWEAMVFAYVCWYVLGVVNVLLLYNTFRVLGPAFDGTSSTNDNRKTMESFGPTGYVPEKNGPSALQAKIDQYRFPVPLYQPPSTAYEYHARTDSQASDRSLLPMYHGRSQSDQSADSIPPMGRPITPVDELNRMLAMPAPVVQSSPAAGNMARLPRLNTSQQSLPAPPRRNYSPSTSSVSSSSFASPRPRSPIITPEGVWTPVTPPPARRPIRALDGEFGEQQGYASHRASQSWSNSQPSLNRPPLSAVASAFPSPVLGRHSLVSAGPSSPASSMHSQSSPTYSSPKYRPLLLSPNPPTHRPLPAPGPSF